MNWIRSLLRPRIRGLGKRRDMPEDLWRPCLHCREMVFRRDLEKAHNICPRCDYHLPLGATARLQLLFDDGQYEALPVPKVPQDPLGFEDQRPYAMRLKAARKKTAMEDSVNLAVGFLGGFETVMAVHDFAFLGGSLGMAAGETVMEGARVAFMRKTPYVCVTAAGGARMQEGILSLMQMGRTTAALQALRAARLPYIVVLTHPTTGGVTASYGMLGDVHVAEPGALIGFAGPRVIEQTIHEKLPQGFQRAEYLLQHGALDMVVHRRDLSATLGKLLRFLCHHAKN